MCHAPESPGDDCEVLQPPRGETLRQRPKVMGAKIYIWDSKIANLGLNWTSFYHILLSQKKQYQKKIGRTSCWNGKQNYLKIVVSKMATYLGYLHVYWDAFNYKRLEQSVKTTTIFPHIRRKRSLTKKHIPSLDREYQTKYIKQSLN